MFFAAGAQASDGQPTRRLVFRTLGGATGRERSGGSSAMRKEDLERCRRILLERREQILGRVEKMLSGEVHLDSNDFPDEMDTAVSESNLSLTGQLREREQRLLNKIEEALEKIKQGTYGACTSCGEEIEMKRLQARPVASLCISCKDEQERLERQVE
jgi:DnaK suppressor protein